VTTWASSLSRHSPAYVSVEDLLIGTNGVAVQGINQEASTRLTVVGFTSDPTDPWIFMPGCQRLYG